MSPIVDRRQSTSTTQAELGSLFRETDFSRLGKAVGKYRGVYGGLSLWEMSGAETTSMTRRLLAGRRLGNSSERDKLSACPKCRIGDVMLFCGAVRTRSSGRYSLLNILGKSSVETLPLEGVLSVVQVARRQSGAALERVGRPQCLRYARQPQGCVRLFSPQPDGV